jgi:hypothetical protein
MVVADANTLLSMSDIEKFRKFREAARLMTELNARVRHRTVIIGDGEQDAPGAVYIELQSRKPLGNEWHLHRDPATTQPAARIEKLRELARLLNELDAGTWRGTVFMGGYDVEDPEAPYLKCDRKAFLLFFAYGNRSWRVSRDS